MPLTLTTLTMVMSLGSCVAPPAGALLLPAAPPPTEPQPAISVMVKPTAPRRAARLCCIRHSLVNSRNFWPTTADLRDSRRDLAHSQASAGTKTRILVRQMHEIVHHVAYTRFDSCRVRSFEEKAVPHVTSR